MSARPRIHRPHAGRGFAALLAFALLWAQALGLAHRVLHTPGAVPVAASATGQDDALRHAPQSVECRLFDQLAAGDVAATETVALVVARPPAAAQAALPSLPVGPSLPGYRARGPPLFA